MFIQSTTELNQLCALYTIGLVQDYSISIANALEILQSCTKPPWQYIINE